MRTKDQLQLEKEIQKRTRSYSAHDFQHIMRVLRNAQKIAKKERANIRLVTAAVLLHDIVSYPKSDHRSKNSSSESAIMAKKILKKYHYTKDEIEIISDAIKDHSFSKGVTPKSLEGKILQDADRLDAIGAIGIARAFSVGGAEGRPFYNTDDPFCKNRTPDDKSYTLDHFYKKLLLLEKKMNTKYGKIEAKNRTRILKKFVNDLQKEI